MPDENTDEIKHDTASIQGDYVLQCYMFRPLSKACVQGFLKIVTECGIKLVQIKKISYGKWIKCMRKCV